MTIWLIEPRDPVIFRDGRPFSAQPGARAKTLSFPFPSTIIGAIRTQAGLDAAGKFDKTRIPNLLQKALRGPVLTALDAEDGIDEWYFPAPADALFLKQESLEETSARLVPLVPLRLPKEAQANLDDLYLVGPAQQEKGKPHSEAPVFWNQSFFEQWLSQPEAQNKVMLTDLGLPGLPQDSRMHVQINSDSQTAETGALFQTTGLSFTHVAAAKRDETQLSKARRLALAVDTDAALNADWGFLGGERRVARWQKPTNTHLPDCPQTVRDAIKKTGHARIILLTPAIFEKGFLPTWLLSGISGITVSVKAAAVNRYQTVSGWDYEKMRPKPTRRLAPAGSVYFVELDGDESAIDQFINAVWMHNISDEEKDRRDGFGLAVLGIWGGVPKEVNL